MTKWDTKEIKKFMKFMDWDTAALSRAAKCSWVTADRWQKDYPISQGYQQVLSMVALKNNYSPAGGETK